MLMAAQFPCFYESVFQQPGSFSIQTSANIVENLFYEVVVAQGCQKKYEGGAIPGEKSPALLVALADSGGPLGHTKPTQSSSL